VCERNRDHDGEKSLAFDKLRALPSQRKSSNETGRHEFWNQVDTLLKKLGELFPDLYEDFQSIDAELKDKRIEFSDDGRKHEEVLHYSRGKLERLARDPNQILGIRANGELAAPAQTSAQSADRVFLSHGPLATGVKYSRSWKKMSKYRHWSSLKKSMPDSRSSKN
jgi:hypothetical protein